MIAMTTSSSIKVNPAGSVIAAPEPAAPPPKHSVHVSACSQALHFMVSLYSTEYIDEDNPSLQFYPRCTRLTNNEEEPATLAAAAATAATIVPLTPGPSIQSGRIAPEPGAPFPSPSCPHRCARPARL